MVVDKKTKQKTKTKKLGRIRGIPKTQLGFSLNQELVEIGLEKLVETNK
jgi:hypothetical protein